MLFLLFMANAISPDLQLCVVLFDSHSEHFLSLLDHCSDTARHLGHWEIVMELQLF